MVPKSEKNSRSVHVHPLPLPSAAQLPLRPGGATAQLPEGQDADTSVSSGDMRAAFADIFERADPRNGGRETDLELLHEAAEEVEVEEVSSTERTSETETATPHDKKPQTDSDASVTQAPQVSVSERPKQSQAGFDRAPVAVQSSSTGRGEPVDDEAVRAPEPVRGSKEFSPSEPQQAANHSGVAEGRMSTNAIGRNLIETPVERPAPPATTKHSTTVNLLGSDSQRSQDISDPASLDKMAFIKAAGETISFSPFQDVASGGSNIDPQKPHTEGPVFSEKEMRPTGSVLERSMERVIAQPMDKRSAPAQRNPAPSIVHPLQAALGASDNFISKPQVKAVPNQGHQQTTAAPETTARHAMPLWAPADTAASKARSNQTATSKPAAIAHPAHAPDAVAELVSQSLKTALPSKLTIPREAGSVAVQPLLPTPHPIGRANMTEQTGAVLPSAATATGLTRMVHQKGPTEGLDQTDRGKHPDVQVLQTPSAAQKSLAGKERSDDPLKITSPAERLDPKNLQMPPVLPIKPNTLAAPLPSPAMIGGQIAKVEFGQDIRLYPTEPTLPQTWEGTPVQAQQASASARSVFVPQIAAQLGEALRQMPNRPVDIALSPEELGRVRLSVTTSEAGVVVNVLAERQETLDLLRRNIDQLGEEFRDMGFDDIAFSFAGGADTSTDRDDNSSSFDQTNTTAEVDLGDTPAAQPQTPIALGSLAGLDLRL